MEEDLESFEPGSLIRLTISHLPDMEGGSGYTSEFFEVLEFKPTDEAASANLLLAQMPISENTRLIAPCAEVSEAAGTTITLKAGTATYFSDPVGKDGNPLVESPGDDDVDFFKQNTQVSILDVSSLGAGAVQHDTFLTGVNYGTRQIFLDTAPGGWTIAAGDIVRLANYTLTAGGSEPTYKDVYAFFADDTTRQLDSDDAHQWGL